MDPGETIARAAFLIDQAGSIVSWNDGCEALFLIPARAILHRPVAMLLSPAGAEQFASKWPSLPDHCDYLRVQALRANGAMPDAELVLAPQYDGAGAVTGYVVSFSAQLDATESALIGRMHLRAIIDVLPGTFYVLRQDGSFVLWNKKLEEVSGMSSDEMRHAVSLDMFDITQKGMIDSRIRQVFERGEQVYVEANLLDKHGIGTPYLLTGARIECKGKYYLCGMGLDISLRYRQEQQLRLRERALHSASNGIVITRCSGQDNPIEYVNPAFERITGYRLEEAVGRDSRFMAAPDMDVEARAQLRLAIQERRQLNVTFRNKRKNGELFWNDLTITPVADEKGRVTHFIGVINDVTALKQRTAHLEHEVNHDALTGLANRTLMWDRLEQAIHMSQRNKSLVATVLIDLNGFKQINDTYGHDAGDEVLTVVAKRLLSSVRESDTVARLSGDEFVMVLVNQPSLRFTLRMVERLRQNMSKPVMFGQSEIEVGASIGVSVYPHDGATAFDLVRAADVAMYHGKATRTGEVHFFSSEMKSTTDAKQKLEDNMRKALEKNELFLLFQPKVCLKAGRIQGFEALLRWRHPELGILLPAAFLPEAEENGLILAFGDHVLEQTCAFVERLRGAGYADLPVSLNVSYREYSRHHFVDHMADMLGKFRLPPGCLEVEMREDGLIRNPELGREVVAQLSELGVLRTVDAFGDGYSDLNYLQKLPLSCIKMAKVAVDQISPETRSGPMVKSLIDIGHNINVTVIAECVETRVQMEFLKASGCDQMQGYYFKEPLSADAATELLGRAIDA